MLSTTGDGLVEEGKVRLVELEVILVLDELHSMMVSNQCGMPRNDRTHLLDSGARDSCARLRLVDNDAFLW